MLQCLLLKLTNREKDYILFLLSYGFKIIMQPYLSFKCPLYLKYTHYFCQYYFWLCLCIHKVKLNLNHQFKIKLDCILMCRNHLKLFLNPKILLYCHHLLIQAHSILQDCNLYLRFNGNSRITPNYFVQLMISFFLLLSYQQFEKFYHMKKLSSLNCEDLFLRICILDNN